MIFSYTVVLSILDYAETTPITITGYVGGEVSFTCSKWNVWTSTEDETKFLCKVPCQTDTTAKAESGKTTIKGRIGLINTGKVLLVSIAKLKKSDSGQYICGLQRQLWADSHLQVHLNVKDGKCVTTVLQ